MMQNEMFRAKVTQRGIFMNDVVIQLIGGKITVQVIDNDDYYQTHSMGARLYVLLEKDEPCLSLDTAQTKQLIAALVDTLN